MRPAAFFCAVVPPCDELLREELEEPDFLPPRLDAPGEFAIFAARSFDMPLSFSASYCFSFLTLLLLLGIQKKVPTVQGKRTQLRSATADDVDRLVAWHADPEVARYWDDETFTHDEMRERLERGEVDSWIVETSDGEPIGYLQVHEMGMDMFLVPSARGRGLGPDAARAMAEHLLASGSHARVTVDPYEWNEPAIRSWERAGFVEVSRGHSPDADHTAPWVLMEFR